MILALGASLRISRAASIPLSHGQPDIKKDQVGLQLRGQAHRL
jgi:hypothetical protein